VLDRLALACFRRRGRVLAAWLIAVVGLTVFAGAAAGPTSDDFALPGSESQRAAEVLTAAGFGSRSGVQAQLVLHRPGGVDTPHVRAAAQELLAAVEAEVPGADVRGPFDDDGPLRVSADGTTSYAEVDLGRRDLAELTGVAETVDGLRADVDVPGLRVEVGGLALDASADSGPPAELIGVLAAAVILLVAFGSVLAMAMPLVIGIAGAMCGIAAIALAAHVVDVPDFAAPVAAMIAIGVGIDYALLVVTRFREALAAGETPADAVVLAQTTAGRSVLFAGTTVVIATLGLVLMGLTLITGVALGIAAAVLVTMLAALTLLPALLGVTRERIDRFGLPHRRSRRQAVPLAARWAREVQRRPAAWALAALALLALLAVPALDLRLGFSDAGTRSPDDTSRQAYDLLAEGFGPGVNGPLVAVVTGADDAGAERLADALRVDPGVAAVSAPDGGGDVRVLQVVPTTGPQDEATTALVHRLRDDVVPAAAGSGVDVAIGGTTAGAVDFADYTASRLPMFLAVVLGLTFLLLTAVFRGLLVSVKAVAVNLLSLGAAFGAVVATFQWGWGVDLLGLHAPAPVEAWVPMMLIAIVFGLSMDYEVFLLSRVKEEYDATGDNAAAVAGGLARTARVITAAAAIMVCVFGSFVLGSSRELQLFGFGLAVAVLLDATVVRLVLVPATMELLGDRNWWLPSWLDRRLPHVTVEPVPRRDDALVGAPALLSASGVPSGGGRGA
jgi:putative drug exporter of the RND superfamily